MQTALFNMTLHIEALAAELIAADFSEIKVLEFVQQMMIQTLR